MISRSSRPICPDRLPNKVANSEAACFFSLARSLSRYRGLGAVESAVK